MSLAADKAFLAAFFFLPLSKALMFISLSAGLVLFLASDNFKRSIRSWRMLPWVAPAMVLMALPIVSPFVHSSQWTEGSLNLNLAYYWIIGFLVFLASSQFPVRPWMRAFVLGTFIAFCFATSINLGLVQTNKVAAALNNTILYSQFLSLAIVVLSILYKHEPEKKIKAVYLIGMFCFFMALANGLGRTGMLAVLVLLPFIFANILGRKHIAIFVLGCVVITTGLLMSPTVKGRIDQAVNDVKLYQNDIKETSIGSRFEMWKTAWDVFLRDPVLGAGVAGFKQEWDKMPRSETAQAFREPHNAYLFFASSFGIAGLTALIWLYMALLWTGWMYRAYVGGSIVFAFAVICILGSVTNTMFMGAISHTMLMLFIGLQGSLLPVIQGALPIGSQKEGQLLNEAEA